MLCIAFTIGCRNKSTQEKLLAQPNIDLEEYIRIAKADESARENAAAIRGEAAVNKLQRQPSRQQQPPRQQSSSKPENSTVPEKAQACSGCGSRSHRSKDNSCPARNITCHFCNTFRNTAIKSSVYNSKVPARKLFL
jgi:coenzyme F420-reducing hydrogenase gamma subunit